jgi:1,4-alpha-glucan branching enzyme
MIKQKNKRIKSKGKSVTKKKEKPIEKTVEFTFSAPDAKQVFLAGEFNGWDNQSLPMKKGKGGIWKTKVKLPPGRHEHKFFADNVWVESLPGVEQVSNPLGTKNFIVWVK